MTQKEMYNADGVFARGYDIYDAWQTKGLSSRKIVSSVESAVKAMRKGKNKKLNIEALAYLFALDLRIKEKYGNLLRILFSYFSWRRETRALKNLRDAFHISPNEADIRSAIEIELQELREKIEADEADDGDDETRGGKRNGKNDEDAAATEEKGTEAEKAEESPKEFTDKEESPEESEEVAEEKSEQEPSEEKVEELGEQIQDEKPQEKPKQEVQKSEKETQKEELAENGEEHSDPEESSEPSKDAESEARTYNDAIDIVPIFEESKSEKSDDKMSFIDEMILDDMIKRDKSIIGYRGIQQLKYPNEADRPREAAERPNEESKGNDKDAYLYDKMRLNNRDEMSQDENGKPAQQTETTSETKTQQSTAKGNETLTTATTQKGNETHTTETTQMSNETNSTELNPESFRETIQVDIDASNGKSIADAVHTHITEDSLKDLYQWKADMLREQMTVILDEHGIKEQFEIVGLPDPAPTNNPVISSNK